MLTTARLTLRQLAAADADFVIALLNDAAFLELIGDRGVRNTVDSLGYIERVGQGHARNGFGLYAVVLRETDAAIGIAGLVRRETLPHADLGFAFLPEHRRRGYGREAALAILEQADAPCLCERSRPEPVGDR